MKVATTTMARSTSNTQISNLSHYGSNVDSNSATPHLAHLRQSSNVAALGTHHPIDENHLPTTADAYDVYEEIGVGAFANVYHAVVRETGEQVAVKVIDLDQFNTNWEEIRREIQVMSLVHHNNVVRILTSFVEEQDLWIIMPLLEGGSCAHIMKTLYPTGMKDEALIATILKEVLNGLLYFHKDGRLHRDLKAGNVLISGQGDVQLADFGVAGTLLENGDRKKARRTFTGTPCWMAPEVMEHNESGYDEKADIWSFGITAMELAYGRAPYAKFPPMKVMVMTLQEEPPTCEIYKDHSYEFSRHFHTMIEKCLRKDATKRPSVKKLLEHKFFKAAKDRAYLVEKIVKRMPVKRAPATKPLNICEIRHGTVNDNEEGEKGKPVSVGSWVFDKAEFDQLKIQAMEQKESEGPAGARAASVQASYDDDTPTHGSRSGLPPLGAPAARYLNVPPPVAAARCASDDDHSGDEEDAHRPLPDFSDPNQPEEPEAPEPTELPTRSRGQAISVDECTPKPAPVNVTAAPRTSSRGQSQSPGEHQEGRFRVCDDADDECVQQQRSSIVARPPSHYVHEGDIIGPEPAVGEVFSSHENYFADPAPRTDAPADGPVTYMTQEEPPAASANGATHVGRFAVLDDDEDDQ